MLDERAQVGVAVSRITRAGRGQVLEHHDVSPGVVVRRVQGLGVTHGHIDRDVGIEARLGEAHTRLIDEGSLFGVEGRQLHEHRARQSGVIVRQFDARASGRSGVRLNHVDRAEFGARRVRLQHILQPHGGDVRDLGRDRRCHARTLTQNHAGFVRFRTCASPSNDSVFT